MKPRVRFAPSPTGNLHIGSVRTALFNWLCAKATGATTVLRIEDTDTARSTKAFEENILAGLDWLGLEFDESPLQPGEYGSYRQSERITQTTYSKHLQTLIEANKAYPCFCTPDDIEAERNAAMAANTPYVYSKKCRSLTPEQIAEKKAAGISFTYRFEMPTEKMTFTDLVRGDIEFDLSLLGDFVLTKPDLSPNYNFAVVCDDIDMAITHVLRGEDHISNTPRQVCLFQALGAPEPKFGHLPIILGPDRSKLSKRHGATAVTDYQTSGFLPEALCNALALLGWSPKDTKELLTKDEIISQFSLDRIGKSGAIFDHDKLTWMNGQYIRKHPDLKTILWPYVSDTLKTALSAQFDDAQIIKAIDSIKDNLDTLADADTYLAIYQKTTAELNALDHGFDETQKTIISEAITKIGELTTADEPSIKAALMAIKNKQKLPTGKVFKTVRQAVSGAESGPNLMTYLALLPKATLLERLAAHQ